MPLDGLGTGMADEGRDRCHRGEASLQDAEGHKYILRHLISSDESLRGN